MTDDPVTTGNQAAYAAHKGVSRQTVTDWKKTGLLVFVNSGEVDFIATDRRLADHGIRQPVDADLTDPDPDPELVSLWTKADAETIKENYTARLKQLEYERESGRVGLVDDVAAMVANEFDIVRQRLGRLPAELAPELAALSGAEEIKATIDAAVFRALAELTIIEGI